MSKEQHEAPQKLTINLRFSLVKSPAFEDLREILLGSLIPKGSEVLERVSEVETIGRSDNQYKNLTIEIPPHLDPIVNLGEEWFVKKIL